MAGGSPKFGQKPCPKCGEWVSEITVGRDAGRKYNNDGTWHEVRNGSCVPNREWQLKERVRRAEWEAKNFIKDSQPKEDRGYHRGF